MLTLKEFKKIPEGKIFASGTLPNTPEGLFMTNSHPGRMLLWIAKKGYGNDWAIYCHWIENGKYFVETQGDKVTALGNIKTCISCTKKVLKLYRI